MKQQKPPSPLPDLSLLPSAIADQYPLVASLELELVRPLLTALYRHHRGGRKPYDPVVMLRDMLWMHFSDYAFNAWTKAVRRYSVVAGLIGFTDTTPAVATRHNFCYRLLDGPADGRPRLSKAQNHRRFLRDLHAEKQQRHARNAQQADASATLSARLNRRLSAQLQQPLPDSFLGRIAHLLGEIALKPSTKRGLFDGGDLAIDGSLFASQAASHGHRIPENVDETQTVEQDEDSDEQTGANALRFYSDPTASWGYSASKDSYIFGFRLHSSILVTKTHELPVAVSIGPGHLSDIEMGMKELSGLMQYQHQEGINLYIKGILGDKGYDARGFHRFVIACGFDPLVPLRNIPHQDAEQIARNEEGVPLCPAGLAMRYHGFNKRGMKHTFHCPVKRPTYKNGRYMMQHYPQECPHGQLCEPETKMGPLVHLRTRENPRLNPKIRRDSQDFKERFKARSAAERFFSKVKGPHKKRRYRREHLVALHALSLAIRAHAMAWQDG